MYRNIRGRTEDGRHCVWNYVPTAFMEPSLYSGKASTSVHSCMIRSKYETILLHPGTRESEYCDVCVSLCVFVCLSASISPELCIGLHVFAFSALTLLVGREETHPVCKNSVMTCWCGYLSGARCRLFAYGPADANASPNLITCCVI